MKAADDIVARVARYLDGVLPPEERAEFERALAASDELKRELELQRGLDDSIRRAIPYTPRQIRFDLPSTAPDLRLAGTEPETVASRPVRESRGIPARWRWYAAAAALLLVAATAINLLVRERVPLIPPDQVYTRLVSGGFRPEFVCTTEEEFAKAVRDRFGQALVSRAAESIALIGWAYNDQYQGRLIGFRTLVLMARVEGDPVIVLMDHADQDRSLSVPDHLGLRLFRRRVGGLVCYEVTPRLQPEILPRLFDPDGAGGP